MFLFFLAIFILLYWFLSSRMDLHHLHTTSLFSPWLSTPNSKVTMIISNCHNAPNYKKKNTKDLKLKILNQNSKSIKDATLSNC